MERSLNQIKFDSIGVISARGATVSLSNYKFTYLQLEQPNIVYRIKAVDNNNQFKFSPIFSSKNDYNSTVLLSAFPNPAAAGVLYADFQNTKNYSYCTILITDLYSRILYSVHTPMIPGLNYFSVNTSLINEGMHYLHIITPGESYKVPFTVSK